MEWIKNLKIGDKVITLELTRKGTWKWDSIVTKIESSYIETTYTRDWNNLELLELCKDLDNNHRTFSEQIVKNYFGADGSINIERYSPVD